MDSLCSDLHSARLQPNGAVLSPEGDVLYITDTGCLHPSAPDGGLCTSANTPRTIFAFDVQRLRCVPSLCSPHALLPGLDVWCSSMYAKWAQLPGSLEWLNAWRGSMQRKRWLHRSHAVHILGLLHVNRSSNKACAEQAAHDGEACGACRDGGRLLSNRRLFAVADNGAPDGIKVDAAGNVWTGVGDGVACYSRGLSCLSELQNETSSTNIKQCAWGGRICCLLPGAAQIVAFAQKFGRGGRLCICAKHTLLVCSKALMMMGYVRPGMLVI